MRVDAAVWVQVAFAFTMILVLVRLQSVAHDEAALRDENRHLRDLQRINTPGTGGASTATTAKVENKKAQ
jgi:heme exporter protein D